MDDFTFNRAVSLLSDILDLTNDLKDEVSSNAAQNPNAETYVVGQTAKIHALLGLCYSLLTRFSVQLQRQNTLPTEFDVATINCIKLLRQNTNCGLKEAKDIIDLIRAPKGTYANPNEVAESVFLKLQ